MGEEKKKIILVSDSFPPVPSGVSKHSFFLTKKLLQRNFEVIVITGGTKDKPSEEIEIEKLGGKVMRFGKLTYVYANGTRCYITLLSPSDIVRMKKFFSSYECDAVILQGPLGLTLPYPATVFAKTKKLIGIFHSVTEKPNLGYILFKHFMKPFLKKLDVKIAVSKTAQNEIEKYFGKQDMKIVPPGIDTEIYSPHRAEKEKDSVNMLFVGRLDERKGIDILLSAFRKVKKFGIKKGKKLPLKLKIAGDGPMRKIVEKEKVREKNIEFMGFVPEKKLPEIYASSDFCVFPSKGGESFGIVLIESMACASPPIASNIKGYKDVIEDGKTGMLFSNQEELIKKIEMMSFEENIREEISKNALENSKRYDWNKIVQEIIQEII
ncbi:Phosphatidyl-myo-inositol mannosyltransferase [bacterium HR19]|nr:Phosphatidyl-myo-inositol mannosyltransferase [bacterium HR19]